MIPIVVEIPQYVRKLQMSKSQLNVYFTWDGVGIKAKGYKVLQRYLKKDLSAVLNPAMLRYLIEHFKEEYVIGVFKNDKLLSYTRETSELPVVVQGTLKYILCKLTEEGTMKVIANHTKAGKPRMYLIKGQDIYNGLLREHKRGFVMDRIKDCYYPYIKDLKPLDISFYPVKITCEVHDTIKNYYEKNNKDDFGGRWDIDNLVYPYLKAFPDLLVKEGILKDDDRLHIASSIPAYFVPIENHEERKLVFTIEKDERECLKQNKLFQKFHKDSYESEDTELVKDNDGPFDNMSNEDFDRILGKENRKNFEKFATERDNAILFGIEAHKKVEEDLLINKQKEDENI